MMIQEAGEWELRSENGEVINLTAPAYYAFGWPENTGAHAQIKINLIPETEIRADETYIVVNRNGEISRECELKAD